MTYPVQYHREEFSGPERQLLSKFFTNVDGPVFALVNLPEVVKGALYARYSRSPKSIRRLFLDEFVGSLDAATLSRSGAPDHDVVDVNRATELYHRIFSDFGDDSVAQLGGVHLACEQASNLLTKVLEWGRLAAYLEQSTRYIYFARPLGSRYRYVLPPEVAACGLETRYRSTLDNLFETYRNNVARLRTHYQERFPRAPDVRKSAWDAVIRAKVCDDLRGLLPAATTSNVGIYANGQAYEYLLIRMRAHPLEEVRGYANLILHELRKVIPAFMRRVDLPDRGKQWTSYLRDVARAMEKEAETITHMGASKTDVELVDWDPNGEVKVVAAALYQYSELPHRELFKAASRMSDDERQHVLKAYVGDRKNRRHKPGRAFERVSYKFDVIADYGAFRDLQRHRMLTLEWQKLSPALGYVTPPAIQELGLVATWDSAMARAFELYDAIRNLAGANVAQYAVPFACNVRFTMQLNAREALHMLELRTSPNGHESYRRICQKMHNAIRDRAGHHAIADAMNFVNHNTAATGRPPARRV
jgi:thymidylate synthase ThyX